MKKILVAILSVLIICSCGGKSKGLKNKPNYFDRNVSVYEVFATGISEKIILHRETKTYKYYIRNAMYESSEWELVDEGNYKESYDEGTQVVTCSLDRAKVKAEKAEGSSTVNKVIINLESHSAELSSIAWTRIAREVEDN